MFTSLVESGVVADDAGTGGLQYSCNCLICAGSADSNPQGLAQPQFGTSLDSTAQFGTAPAIGSAATATLISGSQWGQVDASGNTVITYSFATASSQFSEDSASYCASMTEFSAADRALTRAVLNSISAVCNVSFVEVADSGAQCGMVRYAYSQAPNDMGYAGFAFFPSTSEIGGDVWLGRAQAAAQWDFYRPNLLLHETLHAIGLKHPFDGAARLDGPSDIIPNTVMSYSPMAGSTNGYLSKYPAEPMPIDVAALQALYGAASHNAGDTVYDLSGADFQCFRALWDSSGSDVLDASRVGNAVVLDLHEGGRSDIGAKVQASAYFGGAQSSMVYTATLAIAQGAGIEKAIGSAFGDVLLGNDLANALFGGEGNDVLDGGAGSDQLYGGNGADTLYVSSGSKTIDGGAGTDKVVFNGTVGNFSLTQGVDSYVVRSLADPSAVSTLYNVERVEFSDVNLETRLAGNAPAQDELYAEAFRLYKAALNRVPDQEGLIFQTQALQSGLSLSQLAGNFMASPEFSMRFGNPENAGFVTLLYNNVLGRAPEQAGLAYHLGLLDSAAATRADVLVGFSESPENQEAVAATLVGVGLAGMLYPV